MVSFALFLPGLFQRMQINIGWKTGKAIFKDTNMRADGWSQWRPFSVCRLYGQGHLGMVSAACHQLHFALLMGNPAIICPTNPQSQIHGMANVFIKNQKPGIISSGFIHPCIGEAFSPMLLL